MDVFFSKKFIKQYNKLPQKIQYRFDKQIGVLQNNFRSRSLRLHAVYYRGNPFISMNVTGDFRALFVWEGESVVRFYRIGTHSQLYG